MTKCIDVELEQAWSDDYESFVAPIKILNFQETVGYCPPNRSAPKQTIEPKQDIKVTAKRSRVRKTRKSKCSR